MKTRKKVDKLFQGDKAICVSHPHYDWLFDKITTSRDLEVCSKIDCRSIDHFGFKIDDLIHNEITSKSAQKSALKLKEGIISIGCFETGKDVRIAIALFTTRMLTGSNYPTPIFGIRSYDDYFSIRRFQQIFEYIFFDTSFQANVPTNAAGKKQILTKLMEKSHRFSFLKTREKVSWPELELLVEQRCLELFNQEKPLQLNNRIIAVTGENLELSETLQKLSLFINLRGMSREIDADSFAAIDPNNIWKVSNHLSHQTLKCLFTLVDYWKSCGSPSASKLLLPFPEWSAIVGGIWECATGESLLF